MYNILVIKLTAKEAKNTKERVIGLIGKKKPISLMLKTRFGIHTFGVKFPIDVLILNNENQVMALKKTLKPNRIFIWNPKYERVIELPSGIIQKKAIKIGNIVNLQLIIS